jgi:hypothetical protein
MAAPIGTTFTYQGRLIEDNNAANGLYDFQFKFYDANSNGNKLGPDVNKSQVNVIDGYFTVELDFGSVFDGNERWLDIAVRPGDQNDPNVYTALSPRQVVTPLPYASYVLNSSDIYYNYDNIGIGTATPSTKLEVYGEITASGGNSSNWNAAYSWGNHALAGYLKSVTENDPLFSVSAANGISSSDISNWNTAYSWGNHAAAGYLTAGADPIKASGAEFIVAASNAPAAVKAATPYVCDYDNDQVQINAAIQAAYAVRGTVRFVGSFFSVREAIGRAKLSETVTLTMGANSSELMTCVVADANNYSQGMLVRLSGGSPSLESLNSEQICTVRDSNLTTNTLTLSGWVQGKIAADSLGSITLTRLRYCILLKEKVKYIGDGVNSTIIQVANGEEADLAHFEGIISGPGIEFQSMAFKGWLVNANGAGVTYGNQNGIVLNSYLKDAHFDNVSIAEHCGYGAVLGNGWGCNVKGGWSEHNAWAGWLIEQGRAKFISHKMQEQNNIGINTGVGHGITFFRGSSATVTGCEMFGLNAGTYGIKIVGCNGCCITGNIFSPYGAGGIYLDTVLSGTITGNIIAVAANGSGITFVNSCYDNTVVGNSFALADGSVAITGTAGSPIGYNQRNVIQGNKGTTLGMENKYEYVRNVNLGTLSGVGTVVIVDDSESLSDADMTTIGGDSRVAGVFGIINSVTTGASISIITQGEALVLINDTNSVVKGDWISAGTTAGTARKARVGDTVFARYCSTAPYTGGSGSTSRFCQLIPKFVLGVTADTGAAVTAITGVVYGTGTSVRAASAGDVNSMHNHNDLYAPIDTNVYFTGSFTDDVNRYTVVNGRIKSSAPK